MRINTNMAALNAWRTMTNNSGNLQKSLERLASGYRLNRAADDAAGLAVAEKMNAQIRGLGMALRNTQDAISMVQTAEGGASKVQEMMQRMRELAVQAGSDTLQDSDRAKLQEEFKALQSEIDRTASTVTFNSRRLLDGSSGSKASVSSGNSLSKVGVTTLADTSFNTNATQYIKVSVTGVASTETQTGASPENDTGAATTFVAATDLDTSFGAGLASGGSITFTQEGKTISVNMLETDSGGTAVHDMTGQGFIDFINKKAADSGMAMRVKISGGALEINSNTLGSAGIVTVAESFTDADITFGFGGAETKTGGADAQVTITSGTVDADPANITSAVSAGVGNDYTVAGNKISGESGGFLEGLTIDVSTTGDSVVKLEKNVLDFQVGANNGESISASFGNLSTGNMNIDAASINISDKDAAANALGALDTALSTVSTERAKMGATQNRLENTIANLQTQSENLTAANSRIRDLDMASEMAQFTKFQILSQASTAMLAQANQITQGVLSLLR